MGEAKVLWLLATATKQIYCPTRLLVAQCLPLAMTGEGSGVPGGEEGPEPGCSFQGSHSCRTAANDVPPLPDTCSLFFPKLH